MDSRLQQAIIATRAGYNEAAQVLLTDALQENPEDASAWFLLAHLVESNKRQARYLEYTLFLDPDHELARQHLERLRTPVVPPPVIKVASDNSPTSPLSTPPPTVNNDISAIQPAKTNPVLTISSKPESAYETHPDENSQASLQQQNSSRIDSDWQKTAPQPKRVSKPVPASPVRQEVAPNSALTAQTATQTTQIKTLDSKKEPVNKWLLAILFILIAIAAFVIGYLAYTLILQ
jgi:hypothetical protein